MLDQLLKTARVMGLPLESLAYVPAPVGEDLVTCHPYNGRTVAARWRLRPLIGHTTKLYNLLRQTPAADPTVAYLEALGPSAREAVVLAAVAALLRANPELRDRLNVPPEA